MSSNAPHSSTRRYVIAAVAALGCLLPAACDVAAASPGYHNNDPGQGHQGGGRHNGGGKTTAPSGGAASSSAAAQSTGGQDADGDSTADTGVNEPAGNSTDGSANSGADESAAATVDAASTVAPTAAAAANGKNNGLDVLARDCSKSKLAPHDGFEKAPACVSTAFGEVADQDKDPSLLITKFPLRVAPNKPFTLKVSTRNLVRDRFLGAKAGGYYLESSVLTADGIQRGHFHTACRMLANLNTAPDPAPVPDFFVATQDNAGGATPDTVTVNVTGLPKRGIAQCTVWAGDGSHRVPMMERANQMPAIDSVRILVV